MPSEEIGRSSNATDANDDPQQSNVKASPTQKLDRSRADLIRDFRCKNLVVVLESPEDARNIGTVIRNVNALGAEKVYVVDPRQSLPDDWHEMRGDSRLTRTSASAVKWSFVKRFDTTEDCLAHLVKNGFVSVATSPHVKGRKNVSLESGNFTRYKKLAVWFGNENHGISDVAVEACDFCVHIPMYGLIESLNLATSSGIVLHEVTRQRRAYQARQKRKLDRAQAGGPTPE